jgi:hypothetical protein
VLLSAANALRLSKQAPNIDIFSVAEVDSAKAQADGGQFHILRAFKYPYMLLVWPT